MMIQDCPFCGQRQPANGKEPVFSKSVCLPEISEPTTVRMSSVHEENIEWCYECATCGSNGPLGGSKEEALGLWNKRS
jgi:hypothetical protein